MSQQTPYIGSKISLISKLDIRYEGILYTVDTQESTIALAKVRSFGTEDRPTPTPVAGRDDVYEYIIFKASDIKDLIVCETPKPVVQLAGGLPYDPAIITVSQQHAPASQQHSQAPQPPTIAALSTLSAGSSRSDTPQHAHADASRAPGNRGGARGAPGNRGGRTTGGGLQGRQQGVWHGHGYGGQPQNASYRNVVVGGSGGGNQSGGQAYQHQQHGQGGGGGRGGSVQGGGQVRGGRGGFVSRGNRGGAQGRDKMKFDSDYDFEKANEQFAETLQGLTKQIKKVKVGEDEKEEKSVGGDEGSDAGADVIEDGEVVEELDTGTKKDKEDDENFYDKNSSFFDRISCEALERQEGRNARLNWRKERETNQETFGHSAVRSMAYRRAGGRGYPRGGFQQQNRAYSGQQGGGYYNNGSGRNYGGGGYYGGGGGGGYGQQQQQRRGGYRGGSDVYAQH